MFVDGSGNIFIADTGDNKIRKVDIATGNISTVAGTGVPCADPTTACGDGGLATAPGADLNFPEGVVVDGSGNIFIADTSDQRVREVTAADSKINAFAGNGTVCADPTTACGDGAAATSAQLHLPIGLFLDGSNLYIADSADFRIREVTGGNISTVAGDGTQGFDGDGNPATSAELDTPSGVFVDSSHNLFIADQNNDAIRKVTGGNIDTFAGNLSFLLNGVPSVGFSGDYPDVTGVPTDAALRNPSGVTTDTSGNLFIADAGNNRIRVVNNQNSQITVANVAIPAHTITTVAGNGAFCLNLTCGDNGQATAAQLSAPSDVVLDTSGNILIVDYQDSAIRKVAANGVITTVAGQVNQPGYSGDQDVATNAELNQPRGMALDSTGNMYIADTDNNVIRVVNTQASQITVAGVSIDPGNIDTVAGDGTACAVSTDPCGDGGAATSAQLNGPSGVAVDRSGNIYIADTQDHRIRKVDTAGNISTIAGTGAPCVSASCGDGGTATSALLAQPFDMFVDYGGTVFIADSGDFVIRAVNTGANPITVDTKVIGPGDIDTVVGSGFRGYLGDGVPALSAQLAQPLGLGANSAGDLLITDFYTWRARSVGGILATAPTATPSPTSLTFPPQVLNTTSSSQTVTLTNDGNLSALAISSITITGADAGDFAISSNSCGASLAAGASCDIDVTFTPTATGSRGASLSIADDAADSPQSVSLSGTGTGTVTTSTALGSSQNPSTSGQSVTFTATVTGTGGTPTGTITFKDGVAPLGSPVALAGGSAILATSSLSVGTHSITAVYSGDATFAPSTSSVLNQVVNALAPDFTIDATAANPATVTAGHSATSTITITAQNGFNSAITLTCSVSPTPSRAPGCGLSPTSLPTGSGPSTLTITTTAAVAALTTPAIGHRSLPMYAVWLLLPAMLLSSAGMAAPKRKKLVSYILMFLVVAGLLFLVACGGGSSTNNGGGGGGGTPGTPADTYTITVTATPAAGTAKTTTVTLTVQ